MLGNNQFFNTLHKNSGVLSSRTKEETKKKMDYLKNMTIYPNKMIHLLGILASPSKVYPPRGAGEETKED